MPTSQIISYSIAFFIGLCIGGWIVFRIFRAIVRAFKSGSWTNLGENSEIPEGDTYLGEEDDIYHHYYSGFKEE